MTPSEQLDSVLKVLINLEPPGHEVDEVCELTHLGNTDAIYVLHKLIKDGFATVEESYVIHDNGYIDQERLIRSYFITFEGRVLLEQEKGYSGRLQKSLWLESKEMAIEEEQRISRVADGERSVAMMRLTILIAIGTTAAALYYLNELCGYYHWFSFCKCSKSL
jgi:hypothetical protein